MHQNLDERLDETTALLPAKEPKPVTPLPRVQIGILLLLQLAEPITSQCIYPFVNQLVRELDITGGDERKVGYYAGILESVFFLTEAMFVLQWARISDYIGRKPVLLTGMAGLCMSMICFGLSKTFLHLVLSRCLVGALNGNIGVIKSMLAELTDSTNMAQGFALMPVVWSAGATVGPMIGGQLAKPHERWPNVFAAPIWAQYPYLLPCLVSASFSACTFGVASVFLKETVKPGPSKRKSVRILVQAEEDPILREEPLESPTTIRSILVRPVLLSVANYGTLCLLDIAYRAIQPLFFSTPIALGGLGFTPATIGLVLGLFGLMNGSLQALFFARVVRCWGPKRVFMAGMVCFVPLFGMFPVINALARYNGVTGIVWAAIIFQLAISVLMDMSFGCIFMFVTTAAPNRRCLGTTNGVAQVVAALLRAVGPASATSLFALSLEHNWLGGGAVYVVLILLTCVLWLVALPLPYEPWPRND